MDRSPDSNQAGEAGPSRYRRSGMDVDPANRSAENGSYGVYSGEEQMQTDDDEAASASASASASTSSTAGQAGSSGLSQSHSSSAGSTSMGSGRRKQASRPASPETAFASRPPPPPPPPADLQQAASALPPPSSPPSASTPAHAASAHAAPPPSPLLDLAKYPTPVLLRLIANLLQQIASANDQIRPDMDDMEDDLADQASTSAVAGVAGSRSSRSGSRASSHAAPHPSPTTALFSDDARSSSSARSGSPPPAHPQQQHAPDTSQTPTTRRGGIDPSSPLPLFTASLSSLSHPSSLLSFHARHIPSISIEAYLLRILKYCPTTNEVFLSLLVYFDRMSRLGTPAGIGGAGTMAVAGASRGGAPGRGFAIDSYNVHRLVIAGVTVASKFFSDVFYTNSRYAKVGGLPPHELNQLELQFLLLNDFRLAIPTEEMQRYGDRLLSYWEGREEETGVDVATGRELSEGGRRRARERRERNEREARERRETGQGGGRGGAGPTEDDVDRAMREAEAAAQSKLDAAGGPPDGGPNTTVGLEDKMEVDGSGAQEKSLDPPTAEYNPAKTDLDGSQPAQPPPEPAETASAPVEPADNNTSAAPGIQDGVDTEMASTPPGTASSTADPQPPTPPAGSMTEPPSYAPGAGTGPNATSDSADTASTDRPPLPPPTQQSQPVKSKTMAPAFTPGPTTAAAAAAAAAATPAPSHSHTLAHPPNQAQSHAQSASRSSSHPHPHPYSHSHPHSQSHSRPGSFSAGHPAGMGMGWRGDDPAVVVSGTT